MALALSSQHGLGLAIFGLAYITGKILLAKVNNKIQRAVS